MSAPPQPPPPHPKKLLSVKELATALGRSIRYVFYMKSRGFEMPHGRARLADAEEFLAKNPPPTRNQRV